MFNPNDKALVEEIYRNKVFHKNKVKDCTGYSSQVKDMYKALRKEDPNVFIDFTDLKTDWLMVLEGRGESEKVIGVLFYEFHSTFHINGIYVDPAHRRKGVGSSLMLEIISIGTWDQTKFIKHKQAEGSFVNFLNYFGADPILVHGSIQGYTVSRAVMDRKIYLNSIDGLLEEAPFKCSFSKDKDEVTIGGTNVTFTLEQLDAIRTKIQNRKK